MAKVAPDLGALAGLAVRVGLGLKDGQKLLVRADLNAAPLARAVVRSAYEAGSSLVTVMWGDEESTRLRYQHAPEDSFGEHPAYLSRALLEAVRENTAVLSIASGDPDLLAGQNPVRVAQATRTAAGHNRAFLEHITRFEVNWCIIGSASRGWANRVFPESPEAERVPKLWQAIYQAVRLEEADPLAAWQAHLEVLRRRKESLNAKRYQALHFRGPGTDLRVGLADGHLWEGGAGRANNGMICVPNLPTEEVFTMPHRARVEGVVSASKALSLRGQLLEGVVARFEGGQVVEARAERGEETLRKLLGTDEGASRLGEVALVPHSSPISQSGLLFYNTLFDENAASHLAFGSALNDCIEGGLSESPEALEARGFNDSMVHVDWMIGSGEVDVDGVLPGGTTETLMCAGEWVD